MKSIIFILIAVLFSGCVPKIPKVQSEKMILDTSYRQPTKDSVSITVYGDSGMYLSGKGSVLNNAYILDKVQILNAITKNIQKSAIFGSVEPSGTYKLDVFIINALSGEGNSSLTGEIKLEMAWNLSRSNQIIWRQTIISTGEIRAFNITGTYNEAVKNNINMALSQISVLDLK